MKLIFLFIFCLQLFAVNSLLPDSEVAPRMYGESPGYATNEIIKENGEKTVCGSVLVSPCAVVTLPACYPNNNENYTANVLSGQTTCMDYDQKLSVRKVITNGFVAIAFTKGSFNLTDTTQIVGINTDKAQPEVVKAVGCPTPTGPIFTANFHNISEEVCTETFNDNAMGVKTECGKCPVEASTCTAPLSNPTFCKDNTARSLAYKVQRPGCETGGIVDFLLLWPHLPYIVSNVQNERCETSQPENPLNLKLRV